MASNVNVEIQPGVNEIQALLYNKTGKLYISVDDLMAWMQKCKRNNHNEVIDQYINAQIEVFQQFKK